MSDFSVAHQKYRDAHDRWKAAEIVAGRLRREMELAERDRKVAWDKLVESCANLSEDEQRLEAKRQFSSPQVTKDMRHE